MHGKRIVSSLYFKYSATGGFRLDVATTPTQANLHDVHEVKGLIIGRRYSRNFTKVCHIKKLRDLFFIHAGALQTRTCCFRLLSLCPRRHSHSLHHADCVDARVGGSRESRLELNRMLAAAQQESSLGREPFLAEAARPRKRHKSGAHVQLQKRQKIHVVQQS